MKKIIASALLISSISSYAWTPGVGETIPKTELSVDTESRNDVISFYQNVYLASEDYANVIGWNGSVDNCQPGIISQGFIDRMQRRVNYYRALAGVPAKISMNNGAKVLLTDEYFPDPDTTKADAAQHSALLVAKMNTLTHTPDPETPCFTEQAGNGNQCGNIAIGYYGPPAIDAYIREDAQNPAAGHRRWIFFDEATNFATGDIPPTTNYRASNSLYVFQRPDEEATDLPAQFVAWPPAGFLPRKHLTDYWSLSYPDADFSNATVTVNGSAIPSANITLKQDMGHNSIVWHYPEALMDLHSLTDTSYNVVVSNIQGGGPTSYSYQITFFNADNLLTPPSLSGTSTVKPGGSRSLSITPVDIAEEYRLEVGKKSVLAPTQIEGAEDATASMIIAGPVAETPHYKLRPTLSIAGYRRSGTRSFNLAFTQTQQTEQWVEFNRVFYPKTAAKINFYRRLSFMSGKTNFVAQYCINDDGIWRDIPGSSKNGTSSFVSPRETESQMSALLSYQLPNEAIGRPTRIRLTLRNYGTQVFLTDAPNRASGAFIDDVTFTNMDWLSKRKTSTFANDANHITLDATTADEALVAGATYTLRLQPRVGNRWMTSSDPFDVVVNSNIAPSLNQISGPIEIEEDSDTEIIELTGISPGEEEIQTVTITATSSNPTLLPNPIVSYTSPDDHGSISIKPIANRTGTATITVQVSDGQATNGVTTRSFVVNVLPVNDAPTIGAIADRSINEDAVTSAIAFRIGDIDSPLASLQVSASSSNTVLVPNNAIVIRGTTASRSMTIRPAAHRFGSATITLTITDGVDSSTRNFVLTVNPVNDLPTLNLITNRIIPEDSPQQYVDLTGISAGPFEDQPLTITVTSSNPLIIPHPSIQYSAPDSIGQLTFTPIANAFGLVTMTVTIRDGQATANTIVRKFTVSVTAVNDAPSVSALSDLTIAEDTRSAPLALTVFDRETAGARLRINRISSNPTLIPLTGIILAGTGNNRTITLAPALNQHGSAIITIEVSDGILKATTTFTVAVTPVNDAPTLGVIATPAAIKEDATLQTRPLAGIGSGAPNESQTITITATSSNPDLIPNPTVNYQSPGAIGTLTYQPVANAFGKAIITVTISDGADTNNSFSRTFPVVVRPVNDLPTVSAIPAQNLTTSTTSNPIGFSINDIETPAASLIVSRTSSNATLLPVTGIVLGGSGSDRTVTLTPAPGKIGTATVTITVSDGTATGRSVFLLTVSAPPIAPMMLTTSLAPSQETDPADGLPYCTEYQGSTVSIHYLEPATVLDIEASQTLQITLPNSEISDQNCYRAEYSDDGETWFTDGVTQQRTTDGLTATAPRGDANQRWMRWKVTSTQP